MSQICVENLRNFMSQICVENLRFFLPGLKKLRKCPRLVATYESLKSEGRVYWTSLDSSK